MDHLGHVKYIKFNTKFVIIIKMINEKSNIFDKKISSLNINNKKIFNIYI